MFRYRLHTVDGDDLGESTYAQQIQAGDVILAFAGAAAGAGGSSAQA
jgi:hypothetical protein